MNPIKQMIAQLDGKTSIQENQALNPITGIPVIEQKQQVIPIRHVNGNHAVNARELHAFLGISTKFTTWLNRRIEEYGFTDGADFVRMELPAGYAAAQTGGGLTNILNSQKWEALKTSTCDFGQQGRIEYFISLDMAKELSMVERTDKGKQARQYFIECERRAQSTPQIPQTLPEALRLAADLAEQNQVQAARLEVVEPKAAALDLLSNRDELSNFLITAKHLKIPSKQLKALLVDKQWIWKDHTPIIATAKAIDGGYMKQIAGVSKRGFAYSQAVFTAKGLAKLAEYLAGGK